MTLHPRVLLLPPGASLPDHLATAIVERESARLPDLSHLTLLVPAAALIRPLGAALVRAAGRTLLGPQILTLDAFAAARGRAVVPRSAVECRLLLAGAVRRFPSMFPGQDSWQFADALYALLEELSVERPELGRAPEEFAARVLAGYGRPHGALSAEAAAVHSLWRAFLDDSGGRSPAVAHLANLRAALGGVRPQESVHLAGFDELSPSQAAVIAAALENPQVHLWLHGRMHGRDGAALTRLCTLLAAQPTPVAAPADARTAALDALFDGGGAPLRERLGGHALDGIRVSAARSPEHEARLVDLAVRRALLAGKRDIAVVAQDRRLARRLRALLERAGIALRDEVGWALSTSRAAAALVAWLDCCEHGFNFRALRVLLKSGLLGQGRHFDLDVQRFETASQRHKLVNGLQALRQAGAIALASHLEAAARELPTRSARARDGAQWCERLQRSLELLGLPASWRSDAAGVQLDAQLAQLADAAAATGPLHWGEFRRLLERLLEQAMFRPATAGGPVRLLTLEQARGLSCDYLILAGATAAGLPGSPAPEPVFNQGVRAELGLRHWGARHALALARFRTLLQGAPGVLISFAPDAEGEPARPSPWVDLLLAADPRIAEDTLGALAGQADCEISTSAALPEKAGAPRPPATPDLLPESLSAGAHQALIDCPYQFHARHLLHVSAPQEPDEPLSRRDFGERLHDILHAFHHARAGLPPPFEGAVTTGNRPQAEACLRAIGDALLARDLRHRFLARAWSVEFHALVPAIGRWLAERGSEWGQVSAEQDFRRALPGGPTLHGRIDRLETHAQGATHRVIDYKSGEAPENAAMLSGENVQALHYALIAGACNEVGYLQLRRVRREPQAKESGLSGQELSSAMAAAEVRLRTLHAGLAASGGLPAHGDALTCERCDFSGLCRRGAWA